MPASRLLCLLACVMSVACTSFATVRSAEVVPGPSVSLQLSATTPPGDDAGWFWSFDCASDCSHSIPAGELALALGVVPFSGPAFAIAGGINGSDPYVDGYLQIKRGGPQVYGVGARVGLPFGGWNSYQLYGRYDRVLDSGTRLLLNPGVFYHAGHSPNGQIHGSFVAFVQGVGLALEGQRATLVPAISLVLGSAERRSGGGQIGPTPAAILVASLAVTFHGPRRR